jgi:hypothetical protein
MSTGGTATIIQSHAQGSALKSILCPPAAVTVYAVDSVKNVVGLNSTQVPVNLPVTVSLQAPSTAPHKNLPIPASAMGILSAQRMGSNMGS